MKKKVLIIQPIHKSGVELLEKEVDVVFAPDPSVKTVCSKIRGVHGVIVRTAPFTREIIECADKLEVIGRAGVGVDNIDIKAASERGIPVVYTPDANTAIDLEGKTLGIIGAGRVGSTLARKCRAAFDMKVLAYDPYISSEKAREIGVSLCENLQELLARSDFVSVHVPLTPQTKGLIGEKELKLMKKSAFLINVARGGVVDEEALYKALKEKWIAGAATDVYSEEPPSPDNPLLKAENIILSPHMASLTRECVVRMATGVARGVLDVLRGNKPKYVANIDFLRNKKRR